jgi:hypothetical protein
MRNTYFFIFNEIISILSLLKDEKNLTRFMQNEHTERLKSSYLKLGLPSLYQKLLFLVVVQR